MKIAVLGTTGMLGSEVYASCLAEEMDVIGFSRPEFDAENPNMSLLKNCDYIINCIGVIKPYIQDNNFADVRRAIMVNGLFPYKLAETGAKIIQIATDCVWDGVQGCYLETDAHNATDVYGKTKSLGEVAADNFLNLRCSVIGREKKENRSLLEWFLHQPMNAKIKGYKNHLWNGLTTEAFSKICIGIIKNNSWFSGLAHILPADTISKADLLRLFAECFNRSDIEISDVCIDKGINRTLATCKPQLNKELWTMGGYQQIPTIKQLVKEMSKSK